jgi:hypothetical protein
MDKRRLVEDAMDEIWFMTGNLEKSAARFGNLVEPAVGPTEKAEGR